MNPNNYELNDGQWDFIFKYYPEYAGSPYQMMSYLFGTALENEQQYSGKPTLGGRQTGEGDSSEEETGKFKKKYDGLN